MRDAFDHIPSWCRHGRLSCVAGALCSSQTDTLHHRQSAGVTATSCWAVGGRRGHVMPRLVGPPTSQFPAARGEGRPSVRAAVRRGRKSLRWRAPPPSLRRRTWSTDLDEPRGRGPGQQGAVVCLPSCVKLEGWRAGGRPGAERPDAERVVAWRSSTKLSSSNSSGSSAGLAVIASPLQPLNPQASSFSAHSQQPLPSAWRLLCLVLNYLKLR